MEASDPSKAFVIDTSSAQNVEKLVNDFYDLFYEQIPLDLMVLWTYERTDYRSRLHAYVNDQGTMFSNESMWFSKRGGLEFNAIMDSKLHLFADSRESPGIQDFIAQYPIPQPFTEIAIQTRIKPGEYAVVSLLAAGTDRYDKEKIAFLEQHYAEIMLSLRYVLSELEISNLKKRNASEHQEILRRLGYVGEMSMIGVETGLGGTMKLVRQVAPLNTTVLISGETGVGKEVIATAVHQASKRADKPLVSVNCGAIPETLLDSELFGHEKGAFTDATYTKLGYFEQANGGSVFLDEIGELSCSAQVKLLRLLQTKRLQRVGGNRQLSVDVRVIVATNRDIPGMVKKSFFRNDLWFRINVFPIDVPPLRERKEDIPALAIYFARSRRKELSLPWRGVFADNAMAQLQAYDWPGNVRELQSVIERTLIVSQGNPMSFPHLDMKLGQENGNGNWNNCESHYTFLTLEEMLTKHIKQALTLSKGRVEGRGGAAELLNVHPSTLRAKMKKLGIHLNVSCE